MKVHELKKGKVYRLTFGSMPISDKSQCPLTWLRNRPFHDEGLEFLVVKEGTPGCPSWVHVIFCHEEMIGFACCNADDEFEEVIDGDEHL